MRTSRFLAALCGLATLGGIGSAGAVDIAKQGYFYAGGHYVTIAEGEIVSGQAYVEYQIPKKLRHPFPIVMIEGGGQNGSNFLGTTDGKKGWAQYFVEQGYAVYIVDQPTRGRSPYHADLFGAQQRNTADGVEQRFTGFERFNQWPQAHLHTQWPGTGRKGDPAFDQLAAEQMPTIRNDELAEELNRAAGAALLDRIGPAILLTHSQGGGFGWLTADARPDLVKAIVAVEPHGPPIQDIGYSGAPDYFKYGDTRRKWGITATPMAYAPPVSDLAQLSFVQQDKPDAPGLVRCWRQDGTPHQLVNLAKVPVAMIASEASYHAPYDHCTSAFLTQAGVKHDFIRLADHGIHGNGHMMMLEKNNQQIAAVIAGWLRQTLGGAEARYRQTAHR